MRRYSVAAVVVAAAAILAACGGGGGGGSAPPVVPSTPTQPGQPSQPDQPSQPVEPAQKFKISGSVSGLASGARLTLKNDEADDTVITANGAFSFSAPVTSYAITVGTNPVWQFCKVTNASGVATKEVTDVSVQCAAAAAQVTTLAGEKGSRGYVDGAGVDARFGVLAGVAVDAAGSVYVGDQIAYVLRKITSAGVVSTVAGTPMVSNVVDGTGMGASFANPSGVAVGPDGNMYVADTYGSVIRKVTPAGVVTTLAGTPYIVGSADGKGAAASFRNPSNLAVDGDGTIYVADGANSVIRKITPDGVVSTFAGTAGKFGNVDGMGAAARFQIPYAIATDGHGTVYVADTSSNTIRKITKDGQATTLAGDAGVAGATDGVSTSATFNFVTSLAVDSNGDIYAADTDNHLIRKITPTGVVSTLAGRAGSADAAAVAFTFPGGVAVDTRGNVYVSDLSFVIRKISPVPAP